MAKKAYIGVGGTARKVKKIYFGVGNTARKVKKAYIGIGGIARPFFSGGEVVYYGTTTALSIARQSAAGASVGKYGLIAGGAKTTATGNTNSSYYTNSVVTYDNNLTVNESVATLPSVRNGAVGASAKNYALIAGGEKAGYDSDSVVSYDTNLTRTTLAALSEARTGAAAAIAGEYVLVAGGEYTYDEVDAYDVDGNKYSGDIEPLGTARGYLAGAAVGSFAIFAGGRTSASTSARSSAVDVYDSDLGKFESVESLGFSAWNIAGASLRKYALFAGGSKSTRAYVATINAYDEDLTLYENVGELSSARKCMAAVLDETAIFSGGTRTDVIDADLTTIKQIDPLSIDRSGMAVTVAGDFALFAGGYTSGGSISGVVDVYTV